MASIITIILVTITMTMADGSVAEIKQCEPYVFVEDDCDDVNADDGYYCNDDSDHDYYSDVFGYVDFDKQEDPTGKEE